MLGRHGDADAAAAGKHGAAVAEGQPQRRERMLRRDHRIGRAVHAGEQDDELVAAEPRHHVDVADAAAEPLRRLHQQRVAGVVAKRVVDVLELVEIDQQHPDIAVRPARAAQRRLQPLPHQPAIGQPGQRVMIGHVPHALLGFLLLGDVLQHAEGAQDAIAVDLHLAGLAHQPVVAVRIDEGQLDLEGSRGCAAPSRTSSGSSGGPQGEMRQRQLLIGLDALREAIDAVDAVRPAEPLGRDVELPAADLRQPLGLGEQALPAPELAALHLQQPLAHPPVFELAPRTLRRFVQPELVDDDARQVGDDLGLGGRQCPRLGPPQAEHADVQPRPQRQRHAGIEADMGLAGDEDVVDEARVLMRVRDHHQVRRHDGPGAEGVLARRTLHVHTRPRLEPLAVAVDEADRHAGDAQHLARKHAHAVQRSGGSRIENLQRVKFGEPFGFVLR